MRATFRLQEPWTSSKVIASHFCCISTISFLFCCVDDNSQSLGGNGSSTEELWRAVALLQHHDAVTGTSKQHVAYDYAHRLSQGMFSVSAHLCMHLYVVNLGALKRLPAGRVAADAQCNEAVKRITGFGDWQQCPMMKNASLCHLSSSATSSSASPGFQVCDFPGLLKIRTNFLADFFVQSTGP